MAAYRTTQEIRTMANGGIRVAAGSPISPGVLPAQLWERLMSSGAIVPTAKTPSQKTAVSLDDLDIDELKALADERGIAYTWNIKAETLRERLQDA